MVQGVFYRRFVVEEARKTGLSGMVRNLPDGRVEVVAEGTRENLEVLVSRLKQGPPGASVSGLELDWGEETQGLAGFDIAYS